MTTTARRILTTAAAAGVLSLSTAMPAAAEPDWGTPGASGASAPANSGGQGPAREVLIDDGALEYLQIGLGVVAGMAVAGAAVAGSQRLRQRAPHPI